MNLLSRLVASVAVCGVCATSAFAQGTQSSSQSSPSSSTDVRPATTTVFGDTGLWYVPTGEVLPKGRWSGSGYRTNIDRFEAYSDISNFRGTFAFGATDRVEMIVGQTRSDGSTRQVDLPGCRPGHSPDVCCFADGHELPITHRDRFREFAARVQRDDFAVVQDEIRRAGGLKRYEGEDEGEDREEHDSSAHFLDGANRLRNAANRIML